MAALRLVERAELLRSTWAELSTTQRARLRMLAWAHTVHNDACSTGIRGKNAKVTLRVLEREKLVEWFVGYGSWRRVRPTPFGYEVLAHAGFRYSLLFEKIEQRDEA